MPFSLIRQCATSGITKWHFEAVNVPLREKQGETPRIRLSSKEIISIRHFVKRLEDQITEDAEQYRRCQQEAGNPVDEPEESPEADDGDRRPYR